MIRDVIPLSKADVRKLLLISGTSSARVQLANDREDNIAVFVVEDRLSAPAVSSLEIRPLPKAEPRRN
ncbi:Protein of unknown function, partial [Gryllus bimaculatus]